jgi:formyl-CoA transferase
MGRPELAGHTDYASHQARGLRQRELDELIGRWSSSLPTAEVLELMDRNGVPAGLIYRAPDMLADAQFLAREAIVKVAHPQFGELRMQNVAPKLSETPGGVRLPSPALGQHNDEVYRDLLRFAPERIETLRQQGVI